MPADESPAWAAAALSFTSILCTYFLLPQVVPHAGDEASGPGGKRLGLLDWGAYVQYFKRPELSSDLGVAQPWWARLPGRRENTR